MKDTHIVDPVEPTLHRKYGHEVSRVNDHCRDEECSEACGDVVVGRDVCEEAEKRGYSPECDKDDQVECEKAPSIVYKSTHPIIHNGMLSQGRRTGNLKEQSATHK